MDLDSIARERYSRQIMMKEIGESGQRKLAGASVLAVGCGGLGAPALYYLAAMGIGNLGLCDGDVVSQSNLNRQILFTPGDLGKPKASVADSRLRALNPQLATTVYDCPLDAQLAGSIVPGYDVVLDCLDNFEARFILNDACVAVRKTFVHAGIGEFYGQLMTVTPGTGPCLRCLFPRGAQEGAQGSAREGEQGSAREGEQGSAREGEQGSEREGEQGSEQEKGPKKPFGVVGPTPGVIGALQALEAMKYLLGLPVSNDGLVVYDGLQMSLEKVALAASPDCICSVLQGRTGGV